MFEFRLLSLEVRRFWWYLTSGLINFLKKVLKLDVTAFDWQTGCANRKHSWITVWTEENDFYFYYIIYIIIWIGFIQDGTFQPQWTPADLNVVSKQILFREDKLNLILEVGFAVWIFFKKKSFLANRSCKDKQQAVHTVMQNKVPNQKTSSLLHD